MQTLTKPFRLTLRDGIANADWRDEQAGETLVPDTWQAHETDTLAEIEAIVAALGGVTTQAYLPAVEVAPNSADFSATEPEIISQTQSYTERDYANAVEARFDREAQALGYDSLAKATTYFASGVARYADEAAYFIALRDRCWTLCFSAQATPPAIAPTPAGSAEQVVAAALAELGPIQYS